MVRSRIGVRSRAREAYAQLGWACATAAPWCAALLFLVSSSADAGQDVRIYGIQVARAAAMGTPDILIPSSVDPVGFGFALPDRDAVVRQAHFVTGDPGDLTRADEIDPDPRLKPGAGGLPVVDRAHKGDPDVGLRPSFDARLREPGALDRARATAVVFGAEAATTEPTAFESLDGPVPGPESVAQFVPPPGADTPEQEAGGSTTIAEQPAHFAAIFDEVSQPAQQKCLAQAIYFEARSEPEEGQAAVAQVVLNRVSSGLYPDSVCAVVFQNQWHRDACQFSFACDGESLRIDEPEAWATAVRIARAVTAGSTYVTDVGDATHYHARYVRPFWAARLKRVDRIGEHIFYELRPGQS